MTVPPILTPLTCPDCPGALAVRTEGSEGHLHFECRIGHAFSLRDLLATKEERIEERLWAAVVAFEEHAALLGELESRRGALESPYAVRARTALASARALRALIEEDMPIDLARVGTDGRIAASGQPS
jgi:two-component system chemotaxis response regulator CheB